MKYFILACATLLFIACNNSQTETTTTQTDTTTGTEEALGAAGEVTTGNIDSMCYLMVSGATKQDTKSLKVIVKGNDVSGVLMYLPHEKDGRFGRIMGLKKGDVISGTWYYEQEGMKDSVAVSFKKEGNDMLQQASSFDTKTGHEYLPGDAPYKDRYIQTDCSNLPQYNIRF